MPVPETPPAGIVRSEHSDRPEQHVTGMSVPSDEELMLAVARGDLSALGQVVSRHQTSAWNAAYRFAGNSADAEDIAQEAFLKILDSAHRYRHPKGSPSSMNGRPLFGRPSTPSPPPRKWPWSCAITKTSATGRLPPCWILRTRGWKGSWRGRGRAWKIAWAGLLKGSQNPEGVLAVSCVSSVGRR